VSHAAFFAVQCALAEMWRGLGLEPEVLGGHGIGQFAAACAAGVFSFQAGLELLLAWIRLLETPEWRAELAALASRIDYSKPRTTLVSPATGKRVSEDVCRPDYWIHCLDELQDDIAREPPEPHPCDVVLGIGMTERMLARVRGSLSLAGTIVLPTLANDASDWAIVVANAGALYAAGVSLNWDSLYQNRPRRRVVLPTYPFQRQRYWVDGIAPLPGGTRPSNASLVEQR